MVGRAIPARLRRHAWAAGLAAALLLMPAQPHRVAAAQDLQQEKPVIAAIELPQANGALAAVRKVRAGSPLSSTLPESELDQRLAKLLSWVVRDYANSGPLRLPSGVPEGKNARGQSSVRLATLQHTYWLQDNALYMAAAFEQYAPVLGRDLSDSWRSKWQQYFPSLCPDTQSDYVIGQLPEYDTASTVADPRCRLPRPDAWQFFRMHQYPDPADPQFDTRPGPIIGTDHPMDTQGRTELAPINRRSSRNLLKYGCLRGIPSRQPSGDAADVRSGAKAMGRQRICHPEERP